MASLHPPGLVWFSQNKGLRSIRKHSSHGPQATTDRFLPPARSTGGWETFHWPLAAETPAGPLAHRGRETAGRHSAPAGHVIERGCPCNRLLTCHGACSATKAAGCERPVSRALPGSHSLKCPWGNSSSSRSGWPVFLPAGQRLQTVSGKFHRKSRPVLFRVLPGKRTAK